MAYAYDASLLERVKPRISQWEATTGRRITPSMLDALIKGQLEAEVGKAQQSRALDIQEQGLADAKEAQKKADKAAKVKGIVDTASTAGMGYLTYKAVTKPSAMSELLAYQKGLGAAPGTGIGAQTTLAGGTTAAGGQAALTGGEVGSLAAYDAALAEGAAEGVGMAAGTTGPSAMSAMASGVPAAAALYGAQYLTGKALQPTLDKAGFSLAGKGWTYAGLPGASIGATLDLGKKGFEAIEDIGSSIGDIFGW